MVLKNKLLLLSVAALSVGLMGFNRLNIQAKNINDPKAEALLSRTLGQTEFANPAENYYGLERGGVGAPPPMAASAPAPGQKRAVQEADVFKIGKKGSKLLYLLNSARGLQVVSFADGAEKPKMIGRVEATGNTPRDMYFIENEQRLVVLENIYYDQSGRSKYSSESQARLVIYDVSNDSAPKITEIIEFKGAIRDSRLVGEILYVGSSIETSWYRQSDKKSTGYVHSFRVGKGKVETVTEYQLSLPVAYGENMNIVEVQKGQGYLYYLVAVLENRSWGFWGRESLVEVIDISDANGKVESLMQVGTKGSVRERSQTLIKDDTLVVVSNYVVPSQNTQQRQIARVAVESFKLPSQKSEILTESEAQYRQLWINRELSKAKLTDPDEIDAKRKELLANAETGLAGRFVQKDKGPLTKPYADSVVTTGDTTGQSASLRDVRVDGNSLYVFWVPANNIDPLDLFDISDLDKGVKYVSRLQFDGWIERSVPFTIKDRKFILGLGWVLPAQNNERQVRKAQATLFEIVTVAGKKMGVQLAQMELSEKDAGGAGFERQDKYLDVRDNGDGTGSLLFSQYARVGQTWKEGGKIIAYDFNKVLANQPEQFFTEGGFLVGQSSWIKRIFTNTEINRINAFSDMALATYQDSSKLTAGGLVQAANILELARNIRSFEIMGEGQNTFGVQVISQGNRWSGETAKTEVRITSVKNADAELTDGMNVTSIAGNYNAHVKINPTTLLVYTSETEYFPWNEGQKQREPKTTHAVSLLKFNGQKSVLADTHKWETEGYESTGRIGFGRGFFDSSYASSDFVKLSDGSFLLSGTSTLKVFKANQGLVTNEYQYKDCPAVTAQSEDMDKYPKILNVSVRALGGKLYVYHQVTNKLGQSSLEYNRNYLSPLSFDKNQAICGKAVNIPGEPLSLDGEKLVTSDIQALDVVTYMREQWEGNGKTKKVQVWEYLTSQALSSVKFTAASASLEDMQVSEHPILSNMKKIGKNEFLYVKSQESNRWNTEDYPSVHQLVFVGLDGFRFKTQVKGIYLETSMSLDIASVLDQGDSRLAVLKSGNAIRVLKWNVKDREPSIVQVKSRSAFGAGEFAEVVYTTSYLYGMGNGQVTLEPSTNSLLIAIGNAGVKTIEMKK